MKRQAKNLLALKGVSKLQPEDASLFRQRFEAEPVFYANSWLYVVRAARDDLGELGFKWERHGNLLALGWRKQSVFLLHPNGSGKIADLLAICSELFHRLKCQIVLKKVNHLMGEGLVRSGRFRRATMSDSDCILEDEAYPEHMVVLDRLFSSQGDLLHNTPELQNRVRRFQGSSMILRPHFNIRLSNPEEAVRALHVLTADNRDKYESYRQIVMECFSLRGNKNRYRTCIFMDNSRIHGIYVGELHNTSDMGLYCALSSRAVPGITEWMDITYLRWAYQSGVRCVYLGGSETLGVHSYVQKLKPVTPPYSAVILLYVPDS